MNCGKQTLNTKWCHYSSVGNMSVSGLAGLWLIARAQPWASTQGCLWWSSAKSLSIWKIQNWIGFKIRDAKFMLALIILNSNQDRGPITLVSVQTGITPFALESLQNEKQKLMTDWGCAKGMWHVSKWWPCSLAQFPQLFVHVYPSLCCLGQYPFWGGWERVEWEGCQGLWSWLAEEST